ncbi:MAG TPA: DUF4202 domain-containing protein [Verrucomicrobiae bacterium]|nr:DUF4202 domain-containing protein [Verrucomicrobiae bacterium]
MNLPTDPSRFEKAIRRFDEENSADPNGELVEGVRMPRELAHARWLSKWVLKLAPEASESLRLAARCQHICRWRIPRADFSPDRPGYHKWRSRLKQFHAELSENILRECGYDEETIAKVRALNLKQNFPRDPDSQTLEDALCLVFVEHQLAELAARLEHQTIINALQKSWAKMSEKGRHAALSLPLGPVEKQLLAEALKPEPQGSPASDSADDKLTG